MQKEKKIKYPKYKYEAYKKLNKLFLDWFQKSHGTEVNGSVRLHFEISHYVSSNRYSVRASYNGRQICLVTYRSAEDCDIFTEIGRVGYQYLEHDFSSKMVSYLKQLLNINCKKMLNMFIFMQIIIELPTLVKIRIVRLLKMLGRGIQKNKSKLYVG